MNNTNKYLLIPLVILLFSLSIKTASSAGVHKTVSNLVIEQFSIQYENGDPNLSVYATTTTNHCGDPNAKAFFISQSDQHYYPVYSAVMAAFKNKTTMKVQFTTFSGDSVDGPNCLHGKARIFNANVKNY